MKFKILNPKNGPSVRIYEHVRVPPTRGDQSSVPATRDNAH